MRPCSAAAAALLLAVLCTLLLPEARAFATSPGRATTYEQVRALVGEARSKGHYWWLADKGRRRSPASRSPIPNPTLRQETPPSSPSPFRLPPPYPMPPPPPGLPLLPPPPPPPPSGGYWKPLAPPSTGYKR